MKNNIYMSWPSLQFAQEINAVRKSSTLDLACVEISFSVDCLAEVKALSPWSRTDVPGNGFSVPYILYTGHVQHSRTQQDFFRYNSKATLHHVTDVILHPFTDSDAILNLVTDSDAILNLVTDSDALLHHVTDSDALLHHVTDSDALLHHVTDYDAILYHVTDSVAILHHNYFPAY